MKEWIQCDGNERTIAKNLSEIRGQCPDHDEQLFNVGLLDQDGAYPPCITCTICSTFLDQYGFHPKCYKLFTDITRIRKAKSRIEKEKSKGIGSVPVNVGESSVSPAPEQSTNKLLRSQQEGSSSMYRKSKRHGTGASPDVYEERMRLGLFPGHECFICLTSKYTSDSHSRKRKQEPLSQCLTYEADASLKQAAISKNDERMLVRIRGIDLVAKEAHYHKSCYREYTRKDEAPKVCSKKNVAEFERVFLDFSLNVIEKRVIESGEVFRMDKLTQVFVERLRENGIAELFPDFRNCQLKRRLVQKYPNLIFLKNKTRNACELVLSEIRHVAKVIDNDGSSTDMTETESESEMSVDDETNQAQSQNPEVNPVSLYDQFSRLYTSALFLRNVLAKTPKSCGAWPPTAKSMENDAIKNFVPYELFNFLAWSVGATDAVTLQEYASVDGDTQNKLFSIAQDLVYLSSKGRKDVPKHMALGMTIRHLTGSSELIGIMNGLGHTVSHSKLLVYDTALAKRQQLCNDGIPEGLVKNVPTTLAWDNNDFGEETVTGGGTTHNTNGIAIQRRTDDKEKTENVVQEITLKRSHERTIDPPESDIHPYHIGKKEGPNHLKGLSEVEMNSNVEAKSFKSDLAYILSKMSESDETLPGWTGFHTMLDKSDPPALSEISYLPIIDASPTQMATVKAVLQKSIEIADKLNLHRITLVFDQAIYYKAQQIRWKDPVLMDRLVIRMGQFHTVKAYLATLGKRYKDAGLQDILVESGIVAEGSVQGVLSGNHYNRSMRCHKLLYEAMQRMCWKIFLEQLPQEKADFIQEIASELNASFPGNKYDELVNSATFEAVKEEYNSFISEKSQESPTFKFWISYIEMVDVLLQFVRATREANWELHLSSLRRMIPWFFAYDRPNYARYAPIYLMEMMNLRTTHPDIYEDMANGGFVVNRQNQYGFSNVAVDQTIEQTLNRDSKTKGGLTGMTLRKGAVHRWILSYPARAAISNVCRVMAGKTDASRSRKDIDHSRIQADEMAVRNVLSTINAMCNPFTIEEDGIVNLSTGSVAPKDVEVDLFKAQESGQLAYTLYTQERLITNDKQIYEPIKQMKLKTFSDTEKPVLNKAKSENLVLKANSDLLGRMVVVGRANNVDMKNALTHSLHPFPPAVATHEGTITKTDKSKLLRFIEGMNIKEDTGDHVPFPSNSTAWIIDGMAILQELTNIPTTFGKLADFVFQKIISIAMHHGAKRIDFVTDRYPEHSIKGNERDRRATLGKQRIKIIGRDQKTPKQMKKFLSCGQNKEQLVEFLFQEWSVLSSEKMPPGLQLFISHGQQCHMLEMKDELYVQPVPTLFCDHEEADTRMLLHADHAGDFYDNVVIRSRDTDVFVTAIAVSECISAKLFLHMGPWSDFRIVNVSDVSQQLGKSVSDALIGLHCFTGCDSVSAFRGKGKVKAFQMMLESSAYQELFKSIGRDWSLDGVMPDLEKFICELYGKKDESSVNDLRYELFQQKYKIDSTLPPNKDSLENHAKRANYQACIHHRCLDQSISAPSPEGHGWVIQNGVLNIVWNNLPFAPDSLLKHISCSCKKTGCSRGKCSCLEKKINCSELCKCIDCTNRIVEEHTADVVLPGMPGDTSDESENETEM